MKSLAIYTSVIGAGFLWYAATRLPPLVRSNHVSVNVEMLTVLAPAAFLLAASFAAAVAWGWWRKRITRAVASVVLAESLVLLLAGLYGLLRSLRFFGFLRGPWN
jgi:hypothetical protein